MFFSIVIPCFNSSRTIERLLESICKQWMFSNIEVIVVNDGNEDGYLEKVKKYDRRLNITVVDTDGKSIHCPSNSRKAGLRAATGDWVMFADHDDMFIPHTLPLVKRYIEKNHIEDVLYTSFWSQSEEGVREKRFIHKTAWLHGKAYNREWLLKNGIDFQQDLVTHEDIFFNCSVLNQIFKDGKDAPNMYDIDTYLWMNNPQSITRSYKGEMGYLHENFWDYIKSASKPFMIDAIGGNEIARNELLMCLIHCYFYYQAGFYYFGEEAMEGNLADCKKYYKIMKRALEMNDECTIETVESNPLAFMAIRNDCTISEGCFVEHQTFKEWIGEIK